MRADQRESRVAILLVNGFDKRGHWGRYSKTEAMEYPWIEVCLRAITRHSDKWNYDIFVFDNSHLASHRAIMERYPHVHVLPAKWVGSLGRRADCLPLMRVGDLFERTHPRALDYLARRIAPDTDFLVTLDTDSFPIRGDWLDVLVGACSEGAALAGVYRDEMVPTVEPFIHVSGLCMRPKDLQQLKVSFAKGKSKDVGQNITEAIERGGQDVVPLRRENKVNFHFLMGGIYGDVIYHQGAGSRRAKFWTSTDLQQEERIRVALRDAVFRDLDHLVAILRGKVPNDLELAAIGHEARLPV